MRLLGNITQGSWAWMRGPLAHSLCTRLRVGEGLHPLGPLSSSERKMLMFPLCQGLGAREAASQPHSP